MNILFLMGVYPSYGGVEKVSTVLANAFVAKGYGVGIVSFEQPYPEVAEKELSKKVKLFKLNYPVYSKANVKKLHLILTENHIDIIINQWCVPYYVARLCRKAMKGTNCKLISVHHNKPDTNARIKDLEIRIEKKQGNEFLTKVRLSIIRFISRVSLRYSYNRSDRYVVLSPSFVPIAKKYLWLSPTSPISVIPNPLTIPLPSQQIDLGEKEDLVVCVGRIEYNQKRTFRVLEIWKNLENAFPNWKLLFVGDGPDSDDLKQRIKLLDLHNVDFTGFVDPEPYYFRAKIQIMTSQYEGFPLVIVEGQSYGVVPLILGSYEAVYDILDSGKNGIISAMPYNEKRMTNELHQLMNDDNYRKELAEEGFHNAQRYSLDSVVEKWIQLFNELRG